MLLELSFISCNAYMVIHGEWDKVQSNFQFD